MANICKVSFFIRLPRLYWGAEGGGGGEEKQQA